jgi:1,4-alpha-glucan branching enzyme
MGQRLGAWQVNDDENRGAVEFKLFFPKGDFQDQLPGGSTWDLVHAPELTRAEVPEGVIWSYRTPLVLRRGFYQYKYLATFEGTGRDPAFVSDPCTRYGGTDNQNAGIAIGGSSLLAVPPLAHGRKPLRDLVIYELHLDDFTDEYRGKRAPLDALCDKLQYLINLGVNAILCMPWTSWSTVEFDWGYVPFQIHVLMDGVFNHVSNESPQDLNFNNTCTQGFIRDVCKYRTSCTSR